MTHLFAKFYIKKPSCPAIQEAAARHMIASHKGPKPVLGGGFGLQSNGAMAALAAERRDAMRPQVIEMRASGMTKEAIGLELDISAGLVKRILDEADGISYGPKPDERRKEVEARAERNAWIMRQHDAGISNADIAKAVGMDRNSVAKIIRQGKGKA
ncbi:hypothetical protein [Paracoccus yeei]|uniref:hypothetical protein n=1 Tax=Paracoccus yeei TaxID=147645 RepID=UPI00174B85A4|nr:hypothetical protein [Paracoccus yeei]